MLNTDIQSEILNLIVEGLPDCEVRPSRLTRGGPAYDLLQSVVLFGSSIGAFGGIWKVCELIVRRHASVKVKVAYEDEAGKKIEIEYPSRTAREAEALLKAHPIRQGAPMLLEVGVPQEK